MFEVIMYGILIVFICAIFAGVLGGIRLVWFLITTPLKLMFWVILKLTNLSMAIIDLISKKKKIQARPGEAES